MTVTLRRLSRARTRYFLPTSLAISMLILRKPSLGFGCG
jgi:hypothetical protein